MKITFKNIFNLPYWLAVLPAIFYFLQWGFVKPQMLKPSDYLTPPEVIRDLAVGIRVQLADSFWLRAQQDFDYCSQKINDKECRSKSWLFEIINLTVDLDRQFLHAYFYGGLALTVIISDYQGASIIFDKGVESFPNDNLLNYAAGYHAMTEEKNFEKAAQRYYAAANNGAPSWVRVLAGKLALKAGDKDLAQQILQHMISISEDEKLINRLKEKLAQTK